jgi:hypothetical protein
MNRNVSSDERSKQDRILTQALRIESLILRNKGSYSLKFVEVMTHDERKEYIRKFHKKIIGLAIPTAFLTAIFILYLITRLESEKLPTREATYINYGEVHTVQVHHTTFSEDSTVETNQGIFQVYGAVSASKVDKVRLRTYDPDYGDIKHKASLCIKSMIKENCYVVH